MSIDLEARRQQQLLRVLWRDSPDAALQGWLRDAPVRAARGLAAYRANGEALAARALAAAFPTVAQLMGDDSFARLARAHWRAQAPVCGDMAAYGADLPEAIAAQPQLADEPYLADSARLDWAVHRAESAADAEGAPEGLALLAEADPAMLTLRWRPGTRVLRSRWPVGSIWRAHRSQAADRFAPVREALAQQRGEAVLVWRDAWRARVDPLDDGVADFMLAVQAGHSLAVALDAAGPNFNFEPWLLQALQQGWLAAVLPGVAPAAGDEP